MCLCFFLFFTILVILYDSDIYIARSPLYPPFPISHYTNISDANEKQKQKNKHPGVLV